VRQEVSSALTAVTECEQGFGKLPVQILGTAAESPQKAAGMKFGIGFDRFARHAFAFSQLAFAPVLSARTQRKKMDSRGMRMG
jgi:hypothetical protein